MGKSNEIKSDESELYETTSQKVKRLLKTNLFLIILMFAIIIGVGMGFLIRHVDEDFGADKRNIMYLEFPGYLLLRMLKLCIIPLIITSLVAGMASLPGKASGPLGLAAILYYLITTFMAVLLGILLVATIRPGEKRFDDSIKEDKQKLVKPVDALLDLIRNAFPANIFEACFQQTRTTYTEGVVTYNDTANTTGITAFKIEMGGGTNVLGLVVFSVTLGVIIGRMGEQGLMLKNVVDALQEAIIRLVRLIIWYSPVGICFLLASKIAGMEDPAEDFYQLAYYMMTVIVGLIIHGFIVLPLIYVAFTRRNPFRLMLQMSQALLTALGTASSSATLPITMNCLENKAKIDSRISRFVLPVGATVNMDGTALYEAVASIFIAQVEGFDLSAAQYVTVSVTATAAAIGAAGVPEAGLVTMAIVLTALGLPDDMIGLILAVDWFLDRLRTSVNVWGDSIGAGVVEHICKKRLEKADESAVKLENDIHPNGHGLYNPAFEIGVSRL